MVPSRVRRIGRFASPAPVAPVPDSRRAVLWSVAVLRRSLHPVRFARGRLAGWPSYASLLGAEAGLAAVGVGMTGPEWPRWARGTVAGVGTGLAALTLFLGDMPPFVFYLVTLPLGVVLERRQSAAGDGLDA